MPSRVQAAHVAGQRLLMKAGGCAVEAERHDALLGIRGTCPHTKTMQKIFAEQTVIRTAIGDNHLTLIFIRDGVESDVLGSAILKSQG